MSRVKDPVAELAALEPRRNPKTRSVRRPRLRCAGAQQRRPATFPVPAGARNCLLERLKVLQEPELDRQAAIGEGRGQGDHRPGSHAGSPWYCVRSDAQGRRPHGSCRPCRAAGSDARGGEARSPARSYRRPLREASRAIHRCASAKRKTSWSMRCSKCAKRSISWRFYASEARRQSTKPMPLRNPTGEQNGASAPRQGRVAQHSPWNFLLRSSTATSAPIVAGNVVTTNWLGETPLIGVLAVELMHEAGISEGRDPACAAASAPTSTCCAVALFSTGSTDTARMINCNCSLAGRSDLLRCRGKACWPERDDRRFRRFRNRSRVTSSPRRSRAPGSAARCCVLLLPSRRMSLMA